jgi:hypothetical protein
MLFNDGDPLTVQTVASVAHRILRDLAEQAGDVAAHESVKGLIRPGMEGKFWAAFNKVANFLKHADKDPENVLRFDDELTESTILICCMYFGDVAKTLTREMRVLMAWYAVMNPDLVWEHIPAKATFESVDFDDWRSGSRTDRLARGRELLQLRPRA